MLCSGHGLGGKRGVRGEQEGEVQGLEGELLGGVPPVGFEAEQGVYSVMSCATKSLWPNLSGMNL